MPDTLKRLAVDHLKPRIGDAAWNRLRRVAGRSGTTPPPAPAPRRATRRERLLAMDLTGLAREFKTDKWGVHRYTTHYQRHLQHLRNERFTLLELGIGGADSTERGGESLRMWRWFFPKARIVGVDIFDKSWVDTNRITTYQGSQTDEALLRRIIEEQGAPLVVIDDGSHLSEHIRETFRILFPLLPYGAVYAIEDTQTAYWPQWGGSTDRNSRDTSMALVKDLVDGLNHMEFLDEDYQPTYSDQHVVAVHAYHNLVFIEKGRNNEPTAKDHLLAQVAEHGLDA